MDDEEDRGYSRAPELEDLEELLIRMKNTVRPSDAVDVQFLRLRIAAEEDLDSE